MLCDCIFIYVCNYTNNYAQWLYRLANVLDSNKPSKVTTFECHLQHSNVFHYIMEYVGNFSNPCLLHEQSKGEFIFLGTPQ